MAQYPLCCRYLQANSVYSSSPQTNVAGAHSHYCAVTRLDYLEYQNCLATAAAPLAATTAAAPNNTATSAPIVHHTSIMTGSVLFVLAIR
ncbi:hypothetical protein J6590_074547 [Homalodisca vitripennis]|nr:hypothetical protein J6590_074547 [Homalodisca vitripennis]